jgi:hypothetical protein
MADLLQFKIGTSATVMQTFTVDGLPADLDSGVPTVTITRPDGTTIASGTVSGAWAGPPARSTGQYRFVLAGQPECTLLSVTWAGTIGGQPQTLHDTIEIVGADLFGLAAFRGLKVANGYPFAAGAPLAYSDSQIRDARTEILSEMTGILGFPPIPRYARETHDADSGGGIVLHEHKPLRLLSVTVAGTAQTIGGYYLHPAGILRPIAGYVAGPAIPYGVGNVTVEYVHGWPRIEGNGSHVAMLWAAAQLNPSGFSSASTVSMPDGSTYTYEPSETGRGGYVRHTGIRDVDRWLNRWRAVAGVA